MTTSTAQEAFDLFEAHRAEYLAAARAFMRQFAKHGQIVTVNDLTRNGPPLPEGVDPRVRGAVFMENGVWERVGYTQSKRRVSHGRPVMQFRLVGA